MRADFGVSSLEVDYSMASVRFEEPFLRQIQLNETKSICLNKVQHKIH